MNGTDYAFAVAKIRELENGLLTKAQTDSLINAATVEEILATLSSKGWVTENGIDYMLKNESMAAYETVEELCEGANEIKIFVLQNDFHNLKAAIKALVSGVDPKDYFIAPSSVDLAELSYAVSNRNFDNLPDYLKKAADAAFEKLGVVPDGQAVDTVIDRSALETMLALAGSGKSETAQKYAELTAAASNIKIAYRGAAAGKKQEFFEEALCETEALSKEILIRAALKGKAEVINAVNESYPEFAAALQVSVSALEREYDEQVSRLMNDSALMAFGIEPIIAFYHKKTAEIKNVRMIITCKNMNMSPDKISERVRELNV